MYFCNSPSSSCVSVSDPIKSIKVNLIVGGTYFHQDPNHFLKITCFPVELQPTNLDLGDKRSCPQPTAPSVLCWDPVTLLKMNADLLKYSSSQRRKQVLVWAEWAATTSLSGRHRVVV